MAEIAPEAKFQRWGLLLLPVIVLCTRWRKSDVSLWGAVPGRIWADNVVFTQEIGRGQTVFRQRSRASAVNCAAWLRHKAYGRYCRVINIPALDKVAGAHRIHHSGIAVSE